MLTTPMLAVKRLGDDAIVPLHPFNKGGWIIAGEHVGDEELRICHMGDHRDAADRFTQSLAYGHPRPISRRYASHILQDREVVEIDDGHHQVSVTTTASGTHQRRDLLREGIPGQQAGKRFNVVEKNLRVDQLQQRPASEYRKHVDQYDKKYTGYRQHGIGPGHPRRQNDECGGADQPHEHQQPHRMKQRDEAAQAGKRGRSQEPKQRIGLNQARRRNADRTGDGTQLRCDPRGPTIPQPDGGHHQAAHRPDGRHAAAPQTGRANRARGQQQRNSPDPDNHGCDHTTGRRLRSPRREKRCQPIIVVTIAFPASPCRPHRPLHETVTYIVQQTHPTNPVTDVLRLHK